MWQHTISSACYTLYLFGLLKWPVYLPLLLYAVRPILHASPSNQRGLIDLFPFRLRVLFAPDRSSTFLTMLGLKNKIRGAGPHSVWACSLRTWWRPTAVVCLVWERTSAPNDAAVGSEICSVDFVLDRSNSRVWHVALICIIRYRYMWHMRVAVGRSGE